VEWAVCQRVDQQPRRPNPVPSTRHYVFVTGRVELETFATQHGQCEGTTIMPVRCLASAIQQESNMPILLLVGVPVFLLGGGYLIIHAMH
jgi:hypothetical protein